LIARAAQDEHGRRDCDEFRDCHKKSPPFWSAPARSSFVGALSHSIFLLHGAGHRAELRARAPAGSAIYFRISRAVAARPIALESRIRERPFGLA
jgi:hypothetical protein